MAVPHVTGVAAKIWRAVSSFVSMHNKIISHLLIPTILGFYCDQCPLCSNQNVETCLLDTAIDLGETGRDVYYGYGLVQAEDAYLCLVNTIQCCGNVKGSPINVVFATNVQSPSSSPTSTPTTTSNWDMKKAMVQVSALLLLLQLLIFRFLPAY
jgi:hypothetical protein